VLGDVQETIYVVEEDDDGDETVKVGGLVPCHDFPVLICIAENTQKVGNAVRSRYVSFRYCPFRSILHIS
jgi:hypothetical protein